MAEKLVEKLAEKLTDRREAAQAEPPANVQPRSFGVLGKESATDDLHAGLPAKVLGLPSQQSIDLLTRLLQEFERRSESSPTVPPDVARDVAFVNAAFDSVKSALALADRPIVVNGVVPGGGPKAGGTVVTITGSHFLEGAKVRFGTDEAVNVIHDSLTQIRATSPRVLTSGTVDVFVDSLAGSARLTGGFTYSE